MPRPSVSIEISRQLESSLPFGTASPPFPWATPAVDAMVCALDARALGTSEIVRRVKHKFPTLAHVAIPLHIVERRLLILDQRIELDYFKRGIGYGSTAVTTGAESSRAVKHGLAIHGRHGEPWESIGNGIDISHRYSPAISLHLTNPASARGAKLGLAIHKGHGETWEVLEQAVQRSETPKPFEDETTIIGSIDESVPAPPLPHSVARNENTRPPAVEKSVRKMKSFNDETIKAKETTSRCGTPTPTRIVLSPWPTIPQHIKPYRGVRHKSTDALSQELVHRPLSPIARVIHEENKPPRRVLKKRSKSGMNRSNTPNIYLVKPSGEWQGGGPGNGKENVPMVRL